MYKHSFIKVWVYDITIDGETKRLEFPSKLDYTTTLRKWYRAGHKSCYIRFIETYIYS